MAVDCGEAPGNTTIDCSHPWAEGCTSKLRFEFPSIWNFTQRIYERCPTDPRLFKAANGTSLPALTKDACEHIAGSDFNYYQSSVSWTRLTTWKFPLLQLLATFPRPPLGYLSQLFVMAHLLGDPIDTIKNLLLKLSICHSRAQKWKVLPSLFMEQHSSDDVPADSEDHLAVSLDQLEQDRRWKALALLCDAYDEWGFGKESEVKIESLLGKVEDTKKENLMNEILQIADSLAADRATKYFPIVIALSFFIGLVVVALVRTREAVDSCKDALDPDTCIPKIFINLEVHSVAFSALFFWVIPAVFLGSVIGVSQTEERIRRILKRFHDDLEKDFEELAEERDELRKFVGNDWDRVFNGGLYSWRPLYWHPVQSSFNAPANNQRPKHQKFFRKWWSYQKVVPYLIVLIPTLAGALTSYNVPPEGWNCRVKGQVYGIFIPWVISAQLDFILDHLHPIPQASETQGKRKTLFWKVPWWEHEKRTRLFMVMYIKDVAVTLVTIMYTLFTIVGCLNKCSCWMSDTTGLVLPQQPDVNDTLRRRLNVDYPAYIFSGIAIELLVVPFCVWLKYYDALRVFVQRDDGQSNCEWYWQVLRKIKQWRRRFGGGNKHMRKAPTIDPQEAERNMTELRNLAHNE